MEITPKGQMSGKRAMVTWITALVLTLSLAFAPLLSAATHGPGQAAMEADHAAWHAEQGEHWHATDHGHHDSADHDHTPTVILPAASDLEPPPPAGLRAAQATGTYGIIRDGPRRPPRLT